MCHQFGQVARKFHLGHFSQDPIMHFHGCHLNVGKKSRLVAAPAIGLRLPSTLFGTLVIVPKNRRGAALANRLGKLQAFPAVLAVASVPSTGKPARYHS